MGNCARKCWGRKEEDCCCQAKQFNAEYPDGEFRLQGAGVLGAGEANGRSDEPVRGGEGCIRPPELGKPFPEAGRNGEEGEEES